MVIKCMVARLEICVPLSSGPRANHRASPKKKRTLASNHGSLKPRIIGATFPRSHAEGPHRSLSVTAALPHRCRSQISRRDRARSWSTCCFSRSPPPLPRPYPPHERFGPPPVPGPVAPPRGRVPAQPPPTRGGVRPRLMPTFGVPPRVPRGSHPSPSRVPRRLSNATNGRDSVCRGLRRPHPTPDGPPSAGCAPRATQWRSADRPQLPPWVVKQRSWRPAAAPAPATVGSRHTPPPPHRHGGDGHTERTARRAARARRCTATGGA